MYSGTNPAGASASTTSPMLLPSAPVMPDIKSSSNKDELKEDWKQPIRAGNAELGQALNELDQLEKSLCDAHDLDSKESEEFYAHAVLLQRVGKEDLYKRLLYHFKLDKNRLLEEIAMNNELLAAREKKLRDKRDELAYEDEKWRNVFYASFAVLQMKYDAEYKHQQNEYEREKRIYDTLSRESAKRKDLLTQAMFDLSKAKDDKEKIHKVCLKYPTILKFDPASQKQSVGFLLADNNASKPPTKPQPRKMYFPLVFLAAMTAESAVATVKGGEDLREDPWLKKFVAEREIETERYGKEQMLLRVFEANEVKRFVANNDFGMVKRADVPRLVQEYEQTKIALKAESIAAYKEADGKAIVLKTRIDGVFKLLNITKQKFDQANKEKDLKRITLFEDLEAASQNYAPSLAEFEQEVMALKNHYALCDERFGLSHKEKPFLNLATRYFSQLNKLFNAANATIRDNKQAIAQARIEQAQQELLGLWRVAIEKNVPFWSGQISSFWGSRAKIEEVSVPNGIAQLYGKFQPTENQKSSEAVLLDCYKIVRAKTASIMPGFEMFKIRSVSTTEAFYKVFSENLTLDGIKNLTLEKVAAIKAALSMIEDKRRVDGTSKLNLERIQMPASVNPAASEKEVEIEGSVPLSQEGDADDSVIKAALSVTGDKRQAKGSSKLNLEPLQVVGRINLAAPGKEVKREGYMPSPREGVGGANSIFSPQPVELASPSAPDISAASAYMQFLNGPRAR